MAPKKKTPTSKRLVKSGKKSLSLAKKAAKNKSLSAKHRASAKADAQENKKSVKLYKEWLDSDKDRAKGEVPGVNAALRTVRKRAAAKKKAATKKKKKK